MFNSIRILILIFFSLVCLIATPNNLLFAQSDSTKKEPINESSYVMSKSPTTAMWRSLALPGLGQLYVESYWKAPIFFAATGALVYLIVDNQIKFADYSNRLDAMTKSDPNYNVTLLYREYYRDNRDMSGFYLLGVYILAAVDAYVGAHLYDFQVDDDLALKIGLSSSPTPSISVRIKF